MQDRSSEEAAQPVCYATLYDEISAAYDFSQQTHQHLLRIVHVLKQDGESGYHSVPHEIIDMVVRSLGLLLREDNAFAKQFRDSWFLSLPVSLQEAVEDWEETTLVLSSSSEEEAIIHHREFGFAQSVLMGVKRFVAAPKGEGVPEYDAEYDANSRMLLRDIVQLAEKYEKIHNENTHCHDKRITAMLVLSEKTNHELFQFIKTLYSVYCECEFESWLDCFLGRLPLFLDNAEYDALYPMPKSAPRPETVPALDQPRRRFTLPARKSDAPSRSVLRFFSRKDRSSKVDVASSRDRKNTK